MRKIYLQMIIAVFCNYHLCYSQTIKKEYYNSGKILREFRVDSEGINNGSDIYYFENGKTSEKKTWYNGKLTDSIFTYNISGEILMKGFINKNGLLKMYKNDTLYYEGQLDKDKLKGNVVYFKNDDIILSKFLNENKENGFGVLLDESSLKPKFIYESNNDKKDGLLIEFYDNGIIKSFRTKSLTSTNSQYYEFYPTGTLKIMGCKMNGAFNGYVYYFNDKGKIDRRVFYKKGEAIVD